MTTLKQYFDVDFNRVLSIHKPIGLQMPSFGEKLEVIARLHCDFEANAKYISYYVPSTSHPVEFCHKLVNHLELALDLSTGVFIQEGYFDLEDMPSSELIFTKRIFIYSESVLPIGGLSALVQYGKEKDVLVIFRGPEYLARRMQTEKPLAFISHDSRDKDLIAYPIAIQLQKLMCPVWYDEFSLKIGDSLRESIERGIKECHKCVLVLSPNFLANEGWTKVEFNSVFTKQIIERENVILPVWHNVTPRDIYEYSPSLADKLAVQWSLGTEEVCRRLYRAILG